MHLYDILRRPLITEKGTLLQEQNKYLFEVDRRANKVQIREAVEKAFNVEVSDVNIVNVKGKVRRVGRHSGRTRDWKKAVVTLKQGYKLDLFEGV